MNEVDVSWRAFLSNEPLMVAAFAWCISAIIKVVITLITDRKLILVRMMGTGGMPSTHTAPVIAFMTCVGLIYGLNHPYFAIGFVISLVVMYDATNLRQEAGRHAEAINILFDELISKGRIRKEKWKTMKELLGHTYLEVAVGAIIGFLAAVWGHLIWISAIGIPQIG